MILCFLSFMKLVRVSKRLPDTPFCSSLEIRPLYHTLPKAFDMSKNTYRTSWLWAKNFYIWCVIDRTLLVQESPGLKPAGFAMLNYSQWQTWAFCYTITFQISSLKQAVKKYGDSSLALACCFLKAGTTLAFFHSQGNFPFSEHGWKIIFRSLKIDLSQIFNIQILIILWQWALLWVKISIFLRYMSKTQVMKVTCWFF